ncbi:expressed unknown protein [Seminavis robusta]|uniref:Uncharacterized protein n=1 Tax=Seminavis robusta TaxID=568900 RepID=A0A9N8HLB9_9STRA|nr:expressed unknown protein [Seminavis robusta]|eukprot:Sro810_g205740.1 n/a (321) ;mRNA; f:20448-21410
MTQSSSLILDNEATAIGQSHHKDMTMPASTSIDNTTNDEGRHCRSGNITKKAADQAEWTPVYLNYNKKLTFTGIVVQIKSLRVNVVREDIGDGNDKEELPATIVLRKKLNEPTGAYAGPGHLMNDLELDTECSHYDNGDSLEKFCFNKDLPLIDFSNKPSKFHDSDEDFFDIKFPFSTDSCNSRSTRVRTCSKKTALSTSDNIVTKRLKKRNNGSTRRKTLGSARSITRSAAADMTPQIRAGDLVKVILYDRAHGRSMMARVWIEVISVTATGWITGLSCETLPIFGIKRSFAAVDLLAFQTTHVLGVIHGENWGDYKGC